ncbi:MAG TPA: glycoside hydrolase family 127 protein [Opitutaceae bacterium]|nr:glycoside hydrolase family 127 protein [Opitutaceae bacterium]
MKPLSLRPLLVVVAVVAAGAGAPARAGERALVDTVKSPGARMYQPDLGDAHWTGGFWGDRFTVCREAMIPTMWTLFQDENREGDWTNFLAAAGKDATFDGRRLDGRHHGPSFSDGDFFKWFEAVAQMYASTHDPQLDALMDRIIPVVAAAQRPDGYLFTEATLAARGGGAAGETEFADPGHFETYNLGHLMTAACVHYRATGKTALLDVARKAAGFLETFYQQASPALARSAICPSHYMGLVELYRTTGDAQYLALARRLIELRDHVADGTDQNQDRVPFTAMTGAVGHAVRANYLYAGVADLVAETGDPARWATLQRIAADVAGRKLYITGETGALYDGASPDGSADHPAIGLVAQAYGRDYQLPNLTAYNESCATVGYVLWTWRMLALTGDARYADLVERSLYNGVLAGVSLDGTRFFYTNPLRKLHDFAWPLRWSRDRQDNIPESFCCPPNLVRTIAEAQDYIYGLAPGALWVNLYGASTLDTAWSDGARIRLHQETDYPWSGAVKLVVDAAPDRPFALRLRIPGWSQPGAATVRVNGEPAAGTPQPGTYFELSRPWRAGDVIELNIRFQPELIEAGPLVEETLNQAAVRNGPIVYCLESNDLPAGVRLEDVALPLAAGPDRFTVSRRRIAGADLAVLTGPGLVLPRGRPEPDGLYREVNPAPPRPITLTLVPYYAWDNRGDTEMSVWLPVR